MKIEQVEQARLPLKHVAAATLSPIVGETRGLILPADDVGDVEKARHIRDVNFSCTSEFTSDIELLTRK